MTDTGETLRKTPSMALHVALGAKMVPFSGYDMPVQYPSGVLKEHLHTREKAGLFDVSHMGQAFLSGSDPAKALERLTPADVVGLKEGMQRYGLLLNDQARSKTISCLSKLTGEPALYLVVNAGTKEGDFAYIAEKLKGIAALEPKPDRALLALQGPGGGRRARTPLARHRQVDLHESRALHCRRRARDRQPLRLHRRRRFRNLSRSEGCGEGRPCTARRIRSAPHRPRRARQPAS